MNLENRVINFASKVLFVCDTIKPTESGKHLKSQLIRSGTSVALNFGEARSSESRKDLFHKISIVVKELRESQINMKLLKINNLTSDEAILQKTLEENNQLIAIFVKSLQTIRSKLNQN